MFSTGSIAWSGSLSYNNYTNNVSRITENVLRRFSADAPIPPPTHHAHAHDPSGRPAMNTGKESAAMFRHIILAASLVLASLAPAFAQDASVVGTVADESKAVLPGVTMTATHVASGRTYTYVTNERGEYRLLGLGPGTLRDQGRAQRLRDRRRSRTSSSWSGRMRRCRSR